MSVSLSVPGKFFSLYLAAFLCLSMPTACFSTPSGQSESAAPAPCNKERKAKRKARKEEKKKAKEQKHQEIIHKSENDAELEKMKAEKDKKKGIK
jgi:hypothetical protein